jgi:hypothetical protein
MKSGLPLLLALAACLGMAAPVQAQQAVPVSSVPVPDELEMSKLIWTTMAAVDHANLSGNYSVLRDLAAPGFQMANDPAKLTQIFTSLRLSGVDLSNTLLLGPTYTMPPRLEQPGLLRVKGLFGLRPTAIAFDLYFQWVNGRWRLFGVSIAPASIATQQPGPPPAPAPAKSR